MKKFIKENLFKLVIVFCVIIIIILPLNVEAYVSVKGYYRKDGTYVRPHVRSNPNGLKYDNYGWTSNQGLYNKTYGTRGSNWDTPTYITDPDYYEGKSLYENKGYIAPYTAPSIKNTVVNTAIEREKKLFTKNDNNLIKRLKGRILLQVEEHGEGWYLCPGNKKKYYLSRPTDAFNVMQKLGLGATHQFITGHTIFPDYVLGKILLDVEKNGEAYYVYPGDKKKYYLGRPTDAFNVMQKLGLGITNNDVRKIEVGEIK